MSSAKWEVSNMGVGNMGMNRFDIVRLRGGMSSMSHYKEDCDKSNNYYSVQFFHNFFEIIILTKHYSSVVKWGTETMLISIGCI